MKKILIAIVLLLFIFNGCSRIFQTQRFTDGSLDLTEWDFSQSSGIRLIGEWDFYWLQLIEPETFTATNLKPDASVEVPGIWNGTEIDGKKLDGNGYATYRLRITLPKNHPEDLGLKILFMSTSYRLYINGELLSTNGAVSTSPETQRPQYLPRTVFFTTDNDELDVVVQVANYAHKKGGMRETLILGTRDEILRIRQENLSLELFLIGALLVMSIYHLGLYLLRRKDFSTIFFSLFCFLIAMRSMVTGEVYLVYLFSDMNWELNIKMEFLAFNMGVPIFASFLDYLYRKNFTPVFIRAIQILFGILSLITLVTPARIYTHTFPIFSVLLVFTSIYLVFILIRAAVKRWEGAGIILVGTLVLIFSAISDVLYSNQLHQWGFVFPFGLFIFVIFQSFVLSLRYSKALSTAEQLSGELELKVEERTWELDERREELEIKSNILQQQNDQMREELSLARKIQMQLIPNSSPNEEIAFYYKPMVQVGGDFIDFFEFRSGKIGLFISDVSGHGVPAAFVTSMIKSFSSQIGKNAYDPAAYLMNLNQFLFKFSAGNFVTAFYGVFDPKTRTLKYASAGHFPPLLISNRQVISLDSKHRGMPLSIVSNDEMEEIDKSYRNNTIHLEQNSKLLLYTDGLIEAVNVDEKHSLPPEELIDFEAELKSTILKIYRKPPNDFINSIITRLIDFRGSDEFEDDVCIICVEIK